jgi:hypothetical protein
MGADELMEYPTLFHLHAAGNDRAGSEIWVFSCRDCGVFGAARVGPKANEYFEERIRLHAGHRWEICGDDDCDQCHWAENWPHSRILAILRNDAACTIDYFGNF